MKYKPGDKVMVEVEVITDNGTYVKVDSHCVLEDDGSCYHEGEYVKKSDLDKWNQGLQPQELRDIVRMELMKENWADAYSRVDSILRAIDDYRSKQPIYDPHLLDEEMEIGGVKYTLFEVCQIVTGVAEEKKRQEGCGHVVTYMPITSKSVVFKTRGCIARFCPDCGKRLEGESV